MEYDSLECSCRPPTQSPSLSRNRCSDSNELECSKVWKAVISDLKSSYWARPTQYFSEACSSAVVSIGEVEIDELRLPSLPMQLLMNLRHHVITLLRWLKLEYRSKGIMGSTTWVSKVRHVSFSLSGGFFLYILFILLGPSQRDRLQPVRSLPPKVMIDQFCRKEPPGGTVCRILCTDNIPSIRGMRSTMAATRFPTNVLNRLGEPTK